MITGKRTLIGRTLLPRLVVCSSIVPNASRASTGVSLSHHTAFSPVDSHKLLKCYETLDKFRTLLVRLNNDPAYIGESTCAFPITCKSKRPQRCLVLHQTRCATGTARARFKCTATRSITTVCIKKPIFSACSPPSNCKRRSLSRHHTWNMSRPVCRAYAHLWTWVVRHSG